MYVHPAGRPPVRAPLVPISILKTHHSYLATDTRFRAGARLLSALWRAEHDIPMGFHSFGEGARATRIKLGSLLRADAARAGMNFLSPEIHALVRRELALREDGAMIDENRLYGNALSSMPLCFNLLGALALDPAGLGTSVCRALLPAFVDTVTAISFETSPGRYDARYLNDGTAFDAAIHVVTPDGEPATIFVEVKYSEGMSGPAATLRALQRGLPRGSSLPRPRQPDPALSRAGTALARAYDGQARR